MKKKILLYGVDTYKNKGVEAIVQSTIKQIDKKDYVISLASHDHEYNQNFYTDRIKKYIKHYKKSNELTESEKKLEEYYQSIPFDYNNFELLYQNEVVDELEKSDICISVGRDNYCYDFCTWLYALDKKSHNENKKTVLWGASLYEELDDIELIKNLKNFDVLVIRESLSYNAVRKYVPEEKIILAPDPAFSLEPKEVKLNKWYKERKIVAINLSPLTIKNDHQYKAVCNLIDHILKKTKYSILLLPHVTSDNSNDLTILKKLKGQYKKEERIYLETSYYNCNELKYIISKCEILIAARTHASIAAYSQSIPTLVIGYSVKSKGIAKDLFGTYNNYVIPSSEITEKILIEKFNFINDNKIKIKETLAEKHEYLITNSKNIFERVIEKLNNQDHEKICDRNKCLGCGVCAGLCPKNAITLVKDKEGYIYPKINKDKCIKCNLCRKNCPINIKNKENKFEKEYYAAKNNNTDEQKNSTSGGIFSILAKSVLKENGIVYGCEMKDYKATHIRISNKKDLEKIRGSKYIQSNIFDILAKVKKDLDSKRVVLFSGTPCQIGAIKAYLKQDYSNLITVSVVCHGVLNDEILKKYINELELTNNGNINNFHFRVKGNGWTCSSIKYKIDEKEYVKEFTEDPLMIQYLKNNILRESCHECKYKGDNNLADIIIGDYWGIEVTIPSFLDQNGISALIVNSKKGQNFLKKINFFDKVTYTMGDKEGMEKYNPQIKTAVVRPKERDTMLIKISNSSFTSSYIELINEENKLLKEEALRVENEISQIKNSKRWKMIDKLFNTLQKIRKLGRGE